MMQKICFVISPIGSEDSDTRRRSDNVLKHIIRPAVQECGYHPIRADEFPNPGIITNQVIEHIFQDHLVIADLTEQNPNVFYELGICHAIQKPVILLIQKRERIPFDLANMRVIEIHDTDINIIESARARIIDQIQYIEGNPLNINNPVNISREILINALYHVTSNEDFVGNGRWRYIGGRWTGYTEQDISRNDALERKRYLLNAEVKTKEKTVTGEANIQYGDTFETTPEKDFARLTLLGGFLKDRFLKLHYQNTMFPLHLGELFLELSENNDTLTGKFLGYGIENQEIVTGDVYLKKAEPRIRS